jgi:hypothetical protein
MSRTIRAGYEGICDGSSHGNKAQIALPEMRSQKILQARFNQMIKLRYVEIFQSVPQRQSNRLAAAFLSGCGSR